MRFCDECKFWERHEDKRYTREGQEVPNSSGDCRKRPPVVIFTGEIARAYWPETSEWEWCGEWSAWEGEDRFAT